MAILECKNLSKRYGKVTALEDVNLTIEPGRVVGLLGPNGSGKTTLIKLINGLLTPSTGEILVGGEQPGPYTKALVSYLPDRDYLADWMTVEQQLGFFADMYADFDRDKAMEMLLRLNIDPKQRFKALSKGTREKVQLILVMSRKASLYLLDEPTVIISTHLIADVEPVLDDVVFLQNGRVVLHQAADELREERGKSVDQTFREVFKC